MDKVRDARMSVDVGRGDVLPTPTDERYNMRVYDLQTCSDDACWRHVVSYQGRYHQIVYRSWVFVDQIVVATPTRVDTFRCSVGARKTDPCGVPQHGRTLRMDNP